MGYFSTFKSGFRLFCLLVLSLECFAFSRIISPHLDLKFKRPIFSQFSIIFSSSLPEVGVTTPAAFVSPLSAGAICAAAAAAAADVGNPVMGEMYCPAAAAWPVVAATRAACW